MLDVDEIRKRTAFALLDERRKGKSKSFAELVLEAIDELYKHYAELALEGFENGEGKKE